MHKNGTNSNSNKMSACTILETLGNVPTYIKFSRATFSTDEAFHVTRHIYIFNNNNNNCKKRPKNRTAFVENFLILVNLLECFYNDIDY